MYLGPTVEIIPLWVPEYRPALGTLWHRQGTTTRTLEQYRCDHCGHVHAVLGRAAEPFYCAACQRLVAAT